MGGARARGGISGCHGPPVSLTPVSPSGRLGPLPDPAGAGAHGSPFEVPPKTVHLETPPSTPGPTAGAAPGLRAPPELQRGPVLPRAQRRRREREHAWEQPWEQEGAAGGGGSGGLNPFPAGTPPSDKPGELQGEGGGSIG